MSFNWKGLLVGGGRAANQVSFPEDPSSWSDDRIVRKRVKSRSWKEDPELLPPLLVRQYLALYFCKPFRDSIISISSLPMLTESAGAPAVSSSVVPSTEPVSSIGAQPIRHDDSGHGRFATSVDTESTANTSDLSTKHKRRASLNSFSVGWSRPPSSNGRAAASKSTVEAQLKRGQGRNGQPPSQLHLPVEKAQLSSPAQSPPATPTLTRPKMSRKDSSMQPQIQAPAPDTAQSQDDSLFAALHALFTQMASSPGVEGAAAQTGSGYERTSTLSRRSARPGTAGSKTGISAPGATASIDTSSSLVPPATITAVSSDVTSGTVDSSAVRRFWTALKRENVLFDNTMHQDAHEMLNFVLNKVGEDLISAGKGKDDSSKNEATSEFHGSDAKSSKSDSNTPRTGLAHLPTAGEPRTDALRVEPLNLKDVGEGGRTCVHELFEGILTNETRCLTCETITSRDESFLDLSIDIAPNSSITSCLRQFSASEMLCSRNKFFCDTCSGLQEAEKRMKVRKLPNVLALHLKRFKYEEAVERYVKLAYRVVFPFELRLFNTSDDAADPDRLYELFGIVVHVGIGPHHGHYVAIVKVAGRWVLFDDTNVSVVEEAHISRYFGDSPGTGSAYVLFYQAVDLDEKLSLPTSTTPHAASSGIQTHLTDPEHVITETDSQPIQPPTLPREHSPMRFQEDALQSSPRKELHNGSTQSSSSNGGWFGSLRQGRERRVTTGSTSAAAAATARAWSGASSTSANDDASEQPQPTTQPSEQKDSGTTQPIPPDSSDKAPEGGVSITSGSSSVDSSAAVVAASTMSHATIPRTIGLGRPSALQPPSSMSSQMPPAEVPLTNIAISKLERIADTQHVPQTGAAYAPADKPLTKKEQDKIAKASRRHSLQRPSTMSTDDWSGSRASDNALGGAAAAVPVSPKASLGRRATLGRTLGFGKRNKE